MQATSNLRILPPSSKFSAGQTHQLHQQIQCLKLLTRGISLTPAQVNHVHRLSPGDLEAFQATVTDYLVQSKALQRIESKAFKSEQVPGDLAAKHSDYFCGMRLAHLKELLRQANDEEMRREIQKEALMLRLQKEQAEVRATVKDEWLMREEVNRDKSHVCLEAALLDREFYTRKPLSQDLKTKQELKMAAKCEQAMRNGHEQKKKNRENQFLADLLNHHREFFDFHRKKHVSAT